MRCNCPVDHWCHVIGGLKGIRAMMEALEGAGIEASAEAVNRLRKHLAALQEQLERQEAHLKH